MINTHRLRMLGEKYGKITIHHPFKSSNFMTPTIAGRYRHKRLGYYFELSIGRFMNKILIGFTCSNNELSTCYTTLEEVEEVLKGEIK